MHLVGRHRNGHCNEDETASRRYDRHDAKQLVHQRLALSSPVLLLSDNPDSHENGTVAMVTSILPKKILDLVDCLQSCWWTTWLQRGSNKTAADAISHSLTMSSGPSAVILSCTSQCFACVVTWRTIAVHVGAAPTTSCHAPLFS